MFQLVADVAKLSVELILLGALRFPQTLIFYLLGHRKPVLIAVSAFRSLLAVVLGEAIVSPAPCSVVLQQLYLPPLHW
jgi:hypothetical protein